MSISCRSLVALLVFVGLAGEVCLAQREQPSSPSTLRFDQPIPVTVRKTNNSIMQALLVEMDEKSITVITAAQKRFTFPNKTIRSVATADNSFNYNPERDNAVEVIDRLRQLMPARNASGVPGQLIPARNASGPEQGNVPAGQGTAPGNMSMPAAITKPWELPAATPSNSPMPHGQMGPGNPSMPMPIMRMPSGGHGSSAPPSAHAAHGQNPGAAPYMPNTPNNQPHSQPPSMPMGPGMPGMQPQMPPMPQPNQMPMASPMQTMAYTYQCGKCQKTFELPNEVQAGFRCPKCGVVWDQVTDQNGHVLSSTPAAKIGSGIGVIAVIVWIVVAIVRKAQSS